ncbi:alpha/beta fold hydrolase [Pelagibacterium lacus]|nr:alpha/beta hydrolase [Pelagibacterium lacus]
MELAPSRSVRRQDLHLPYPFRAPENELQARVCEAFAFALEIEGVGVDDEFFDLGGDSLSAEGVAMAVSSRTGHDIRVSWLANFGTPAGIARKLSEAAPVLDEAPGTPAPVFAVHGRMGFMLPQAETLDRLAPGQQLHMFELPGLRGGDDAPPTVEAIAEHYLDELTALYPEGPVHLAGFCAGSIIALEMAVRLRERGRAVENFLLGDPFVPGTTIKNMGLTPEGAFWSPSSGLWPRLQWRLRALGLSAALGRWTDGAGDRDFADEKLRRLYERFFRLSLGLGKMRTALGDRRIGQRHVKLSTPAQARLLAAYRWHRPRPYEGAVTVVMSPGRRRLVPVFEHLLPNAEILSSDIGHGDAVSIAAGLIGQRSAAAVPAHQGSEAS